jgi:hypothetical protein
MLTIVTLYIARRQTTVTGQETGPQNQNNRTASNSLA